MQPYEPLNFSPVRPISDIGSPNCKIWNLCCFSPLHLWYFVTGVSQTTTTILLLQWYKRDSFLLDRNQYVRNAIEGTCTPAKSCLSLCDPKDCSSPGSFVHGILQSRILEWVAMPFPMGFSWPRDQTWVSRIPGRFCNIWATKEPLLNRMHVPL